VVTLELLAAARDEHAFEDLNHDVVNTWLQHVLGCDIAVHADR
jgi:hypothetical protein